VYIYILKTACEMLHRALGLDGFFGMSLVIEMDRPLRRPRHNWEDNIRMDLQEIGCKGVDCGLDASD
jgi:hypothetical protein